MKKLIIDNVGPIKHVELDLKQVNVIIGPQGSGKSCILKVASFCAWVEKHIMLNMSFNDLFNRGFVQQELIEFHRLNKLIDQNSHIYYCSDYIEFEYQYECFIHHDWKGERSDYKLSRVSYIPAERNIISVVPNIFEINFGRDYVRSFISDWNMARKFFSGGVLLPILDLPVNYHVDDANNQDVIDIPNRPPIPLTNASSGIQSLVPMCSYLDFLFEKQYSSILLSSANENNRNLAFAIRLYNSKYSEYSNFPDKPKDIKFPITGDIGSMPFPFENEADYRECLQIYNNHTKVSHSDIFLEEPEQNIFPDTQVKLVYYLLEKIKLHQDNLFMATHSHYILYALNNCMLGYIVAETARESGDEEALQFQNSWIDPAQVGVWELKDGMLNPVEDSPSNTIQDKDGLIRGNYFDRVMRNVMADFTNLMNYYE